MDVLVADAAGVHPSSRPPEGLRRMRAALPSGAHEILIRKRLMADGEEWFPKINSVNMAKLVFLYATGGKRVRFNVGIESSVEQPDYFAGSRLLLGSMDLVTDIGLKRQAAPGSSGTVYDWTFSIDNIYAGEAVDAWVLAVVVA